METIDTERHPLEPFLPEKAKLLMLGSFPPKRERWSMEFFYPNFINDMWRIIGLIFFGDKNHFIIHDSNGKLTKKFDKEKIAAFCSTKGIAMYDTAAEVRRLKDNAADKFLEVVTPTDIPALLKSIPECKSIVTTGQKATDVIVGTFGCTEPPTGGKSSFTVIEGSSKREMTFYRMPSSSRAYPLSVEKKADFYRQMFIECGMI
ncbi:MAG: uracil-DNA glycosylase family protein [Clostridium sp.]|nr:uracil-DNA glycosylase family protein [Bacteroides sp.]MCM1198628.1 uracil-DNA glycosylase family protein [Clostridium sp.]